MSQTSNNLQQARGNWQVALDFMRRRALGHKQNPPDEINVLKHVDKLEDDEAFCTLLGDAFQEFESIHPFADGNGRTGRLVANYINRYCGRPIIVFRSDSTEKNKHYDAHRSKVAMRCHMAQKVQEVVKGLNGALLYRQSQGDTSLYSDNQGYSESVEWHKLNHAVKIWQREAEAKKARLN